MIVEECGSHIFKLFFRDNIDWLHTQTSQKSSRSQTCFGTCTRVILWGNFGEDPVPKYQATTLFKIMRPAYIVKAAGFNYDHRNKKRPALVC